MKLKFEKKETQKDRKKKSGQKGEKRLERRKMSERKVVVRKEKKGQRVEQWPERRTLIRNAFIKENCLQIVKKGVIGENNDKKK